MTMSKLTLNKVIERLDNGSNPVELAGYGRESTHKGYLTWLLDTSHWPATPQALIRLVETALPSWPERYAIRAHRWIQHCPDTLYTDYEQRVGMAKVDLIVRAGNGNNADLLPIELKTDSTVSPDQLTKMSTEGTPPIGLVLLLGSSAIRDDVVPGIHDRGCFAPLTLTQILDAWRSLDMPPPGKDWLDALEHERTRLAHAFDVGDRDGRHKAYRGGKHLAYALLASVKTELHNRYSEFGSWKLYDGGFNSVLNLTDDQGWSWIPVAQGNARFFWEFNNDVFVLKVQQRGDDKITRNWIAGIQPSLPPPNSPQDITSWRPRAARAGSEWISVWRWRLPFDSAANVARRCVTIIHETQPLLAAN